VHLTGIGTRSVVPPAPLGDDADGPVDLQHGCGYLAHVGDAVFASGHLDLLEVDVLALQVFHDRPAILDQERSLVGGKPAEDRDIAAEEDEREIMANQRRRRDYDSEVREVASIDIVLY